MISIQFFALPSISMLVVGNRNENIVLYTRMVELHVFTSTFGSVWVEYCYSSMQRLAHFDFTLV